MQASGPTLITHGCRLNIAESEAIAALLADARDLIVVNSCAVTAEAVATARKAIRRARRDRPGARIVVTGCAAQIEPATFTAMAEVDTVVPNMAKLDALRYTPPFEGGAGGGSRAQRASRMGEPSDPSIGAQTCAPTPNPSLGERGLSHSHARIFLPVQNGCDHRCTFCVIPFGRGPSRSTPAGGVIAAIRAAVEHGAREIVLTGVHLTAYGADLPGAPTLGRLVERILRLVPALPRLRLSSLDPCEIDARLEDLIAHEPRLMPHLHLSLQAGDDLILKRMKRRHGRAQAIDLVGRLKAMRPSIAIGADLIAGFPTESDAMFDNSARLIDACDIVFGHVFPYSPRAGTPAARMPQVARHVIRERAAILREASGRRRTAWLRGQIGTVQNVLVELDGMSGHAENFASVRLIPPSSFVEEGRGGGIGRMGSMPGRSTMPDDPYPQPLPHRGRGAFPANIIVATRIAAVDGDTLIGVPA